MYKLYFTLFTCFLLLGCEVRLRDSSAASGFFGRSSGTDTTAIFSIKSKNKNTGQPALTETTTNTTINSRVISPQSPSNLYEIVTPLGNMTLRLYDATPGHRDNFKKLVSEGFYNGTSFHRVIGNFVIQGGDPNSKDSDPNNDGNGGPGYTIDAEFAPGYFHKKGAIAAARTSDQLNPTRRSSGSQFYIVHGRPYAAQELAEVEQYVANEIRVSNFSFTPEARTAYMSTGGAPTLDMQYTVFGELVDGFDVLDRISMVPTDGRDRPKDDIPMTIRAVPAL